MPPQEALDASQSRASLPGLGTVFIGLASSVLVLFLLAPVGALVGRGGGAGIARPGTDAELRGALVLTALCATAATLAGVLLGTPSPGFRSAMAK